VLSILFNDAAYLSLQRPSSCKTLAAEKSVSVDGMARQGRRKLTRNKEQQSNVAPEQKRKLPSNAQLLSTHRHHQQRPFCRDTLVQGANLRKALMVPLVCSNG
jgi:hypothetical protein